MKCALILCTALICAIADRADAHGDYDARPRGELRGEARERASPEVFPVHGEYDWIRLGGYRNQLGELCCGRDDCSIVAHERVRAGAEGFVLLGHRMNIRRGEALPSEDGRYWLCAHPDGRVRCFFVPPEM